MYVLIDSGELKKYPYSISALKRDNPQTSFPDKIDDTLLATFNVLPVKSVPQPNVDYTKNIVEGVPEQVANNWVQTWTVVDATPEEIAARTEEQEQSVRQQRDYLLQTSDWVVIKSMEVDVLEIQSWKTYRQALRDVPQQSGFPWNVVWPTQPE